MFKLIPLGVVCLLLSGCVEATIGSGSKTIQQVHTRDNGMYQVHGTCREAGEGRVSISDSTGSISAYSNRTCDGYGRMRIVKEGDSARMLYFKGEKHVTGGPYRITGKRKTLDGVLYTLDNGATVSLKEDKGWGSVYATPNGYIR